MSTPTHLQPVSPRTFAQQHMRSRSSYQGCSSIRDYDMLGKLGEGTFGEVYKARSRRTGAMVAMKKIIMHNEKDGFPITALREIKLLKLLSHKNVLKLEDMAVEHPHKTSDKKKRPIMHMVMPYMDHDLSGLLDNPSVKFTEPQVKCYLLQLLEGLRYLHENRILHRDMKAANLLINNRGVLQIADFGLARQYDGDIPQPGHGGGEGRRDYTSLVVTRWYRPPELLLQLKRYTSAIDVWGVGCVFGEMLTGKPILNGVSDGHQLEIIWDLCGSPTEDNMPGWKKLPGAEALAPRVRPGDLSTRFSKYGPAAVSLLSQLLKLDWRARINAMDAMNHPYFRTPPLPAQPGDIPVFEESHELDRRRFDDRKAALPPAPKGGMVGRGPDRGPDRSFGPNSSFEGDGFARNGGANGGRPAHAMERAPRVPVGEEGGRRPAWVRDRPAHNLPARPPQSTADGVGNGRDSGYHYGDGFRDRDRDRDYRDRDRGDNRHAQPPRIRGGGPRNNDVDTYIPAYMRDGGVGGSGVNGNGPRESGHEPQGRPRDDRRRYEDRDDPARYAGGGRDRYDTGVRRSRSKSPAWSRDREIRDRDMYRR